MRGLCPFHPPAPLGDKGKGYQVDRTEKALLVRSGGKNGFDRTESAFLVRSQFKMGLDRTDLAFLVRSWL